VKMVAAPTTHPMIVAKTHHLAWGKCLRRVSHCAMASDVPMVGIIPIVILWSSVTPTPRVLAREMATGAKARPKAKPNRKPAVFANTHQSHSFHAGA